MWWVLLCVMTVHFDSLAPGFPTSQLLVGTEQLLLLEAHQQGR